MLGFVHQQFTKLEFSITFTSFYRENTVHAVLKFGKRIHYSLLPSCKTIMALEKTKVGERRVYILTLSQSDIALSLDESI